MNNLPHKKKSISKYKIEDLLQIDKRLPSNLLDCSNNCSNIIKKESKDVPDSLPSDILHLLSNINENQNMKNVSNSIISHNVNGTINNNASFDHSSSFSFSIKNENVAHGESNNINASFMTNNNENNANMKNNNKVIVYNISDEFLIQMTIVNTSNDPNFIKLQYQDKNEDVVINKNDIFYQSIDSFETFGNFPQMKIVNELSVLKNMQMRLLNNKPFCYVGDIFIQLNTDDYTNDRFFFINEFIKYISISKKNTLFFKKFKILNGKSTSRSDVDLLEKFLRINKGEEYMKFMSLFEKVFKLFDFEDECDDNIDENIIDNFQSEAYVKQRYLASFTFSSINGINFNYIPILSSNSASNDLYYKSIFFITTSALSKNKTDILLNPEINIALTNLYLNNSNSSIKNSFISQNILISFLANTHNIKTLNLLYDIFTLANISKHFINAAKLLLLAYITYQYQKIFPIDEPQLKSLYKTMNITQNLIKQINKNNMIFYSNLLILLLFKYINNLLSIQFANNKSKVKRNALDLNDIVIFGNDGNKDDDIILNEVIKQRVECAKAHSNQKNSISKCITLYLNENLSKFTQGLSRCDSMFISSIESSLFDISFVKKIYSGSSIISQVKNAYTVSIQNFMKYENSIDKIYQMWICDIGTPYDVFFSTQEKIIEFLQLTQIIEYCTIYHNYYFEAKNFFYFRNYSYEFFFNTYLPILTDIDTKYQSKRIQRYKKALCNYFNDIQHFQSITEDFTVTDTKIGIAYKTFEILNLLLKSVYDDKAKMIQKNYRKYIAYKLIATLRRKCVVIQKFYRMRIYKEIMKKNKDDSKYKMICNTILDKYKMKDPLIVRYVINMMKRYEELCQENLTLKDYYNSEINIINGNLSTERQMNNAKSSSNMINSSDEKENEEIEILTKKLNENRTKFKKLVMIIAEYEKKMENFVKMINANKELKEILYKNGIYIN